MFISIYIDISDNIYFKHLKKIFCILINDLKIKISLN